jgi:hypothetical protein
MLISGIVTPHAWFFFPVEACACFVFLQFNLVLVLFLLLSSGLKDVLQALHDGGWTWACGRHRVHSLDG